MKEPADDDLGADFCGIHDWSLPCPHCKDEDDDRRHDEAKDCHNQQEG